MFVCGIKEVNKIIRRNECKFVIISTNLENVKQLQEEINNIVLACKSNHIRYI